MYNRAMKKVLLLFLILAALFPGTLQAEETKTPQGGNPPELKTPEQVAAFRAEMEKKFKEKYAKLPSQQQPPLLKENPEIPKPLSLEEQRKQAEKLEAERKEQVRIAREAPAKLAKEEAEYYAKRRAEWEKEKPALEAKRAEVAKNTQALIKQQNEINDKLKKQELPRQFQNAARPSGRK